MKGQITLQPLAMIRPTEEGIYAPSRLRPARVIEHQEFLKKYTDRARLIMVSFEPDGVSNPQSLTAYGFGMDCWYLITEERSCEP